jgi:hypothetical protein
MRQLHDINSDSTPRPRHPSGAVVTRLAQTLGVCWVVVTAMGAFARFVMASVMVRPDESHVVFGVASIAFLAAAIYTGGTALAHTWRGPR